MSNDNLTEKEAEDIIRQFSEGKSNMHSFFTNVVKADDTTRTGNLNDDELGISNLPVRTYKELEVFSNEVANQPEWADYFNKMSEIQTSTSLSKGGFLMRLSVTQKKESTLADLTPAKKENLGWFKRKNKDQINQQ